MKYAVLSIGGGGDNILPVLHVYQLTGAFLSIGLIVNFLSLKDMFLISLHGKPILGVNLKEWNEFKY